MTESQFNTYEDRKRGVMAGLAIGDALGAGYEFGPDRPDSEKVYMKGGGLIGWAPGEWTDDTSMAIPIANAVAKGKNLLDPNTIEEIYQAWRAWHWDAPDVGIQTRTVLDLAETADEARQLTKSLYQQNPRNQGGNGCVMRTAPIALAYEDDLTSTLAAARLYASMTHGDPRAQDAAMEWTIWINQAVRTGRYPRVIERRLLLRGDKTHPRQFRDGNGYSVSAVAAARAAIQYGRGKPVASLEAAVRGGGDTDTVAAIAGAMIGAVYGLHGLPQDWVHMVHGWPGISLLGLPTVAIKE